MVKKYASLLLITLLINLSFTGSIHAQDADIKATEKHKVKIAKTGVGGKLIKIKLKDKTKIKGYITEIKDDYFVLVNKQTAQSTKISYDQINDIQLPFTILQKAAIGVAIIVGVAVVASIICVANGRCED